MKPSANEPSPTAFRFFVAVALVILGLAGTQWERIKKDVFKWEPVGQSSTQTASKSRTSTQTSSPVSLTQESSPKKTAPAKEPVAKSNPLLMKGLTLKDQDGKVVYKGDIDLTKTLERIKKGERFPHRNDGAAFGNRERRLPQKPPGYYTEYVVPTPDLRGPGPQRLVMGEKGEVYYTADHYRSFKRVSVPLELLPTGENSEKDPKKDE